MLWQWDHQDPRICRVISILELLLDCGRWNIPKINSRGPKMEPPKVEPNKRLVHYTKTGESDDDWTALARSELWPASRFSCQVWVADTSASWVELHGLKPSPLFLEGLMSRFAITIPMSLLDIPSLMRTERNPGDFYCLPFSHSLSPNPKDWGILSCPLQNTAVFPSPKSRGLRESLGFSLSPTPHCSSSVLPIPWVPRTEGVPGILLRSLCLSHPLSPENWGSPWDLVHTCQNFLYSLCTILQSGFAVWM